MFQTVVANKFRRKDPGVPQAGKKTGEGPRPMTYLAEKSVISISSNRGKIDKGTQNTIFKVNILKWNYTKYIVSIISPTHLKNSFGSILKFATIVEFF